MAPVVPPAKGKGRPTVTFIDRQAILLWAELRVPEPRITAEGLEILPPPLVAPVEPVPLVLSGARAVKPKAPTPILVLDSSARLVWAEWRVPSPDALVVLTRVEWIVPDVPIVLTPDEVLAIMLELEKGI